MLARIRPLAALFLSFSLVMPTHLAWASEGDMERTLVIVELRGGLDPNSQTIDYLKEVEANLKTANGGDLILVSGEKVAEQIRKSRDQVPGALTDERRTQLAEARKKGTDYLDNADAANAIKALVNAESRYRAALAAPGADDSLRKEYLDVLAQLATAYVVAKDHDAAADVFRTVITTFGMKAPVTDDNYRPDVVELFKKVVKEVNAMRKGGLEVSSTPPGARIILGGNDRGATPATIPDLIPGNYSLRLQLGQATSMLHRVKIGGASTAKIAIDVNFESHLLVDEKQVGLSYPTYEDAAKRVQADAVALGQTLDVNMIAVVGVIDGKLASFLVDVAKNETIRTAAVKVPQVGISKRAVGRTMATILGEKADKTEVGVVGSGGGGGSDAWYTSVPGWAAVGAGVIGLAVGAAYSSTTVSDGTSVSTYGSPVVTTTADQDKVYSNRNIGGASLILGSALVVTGGVLFYLKGKANAPTDAARSWGLPAPGAHKNLLPPVDFGSSPVAFSPTW